jgi:hypothetical protein
VQGDVLNLMPRVEVSRAEGAGTIPATRAKFDGFGQPTDPVPLPGYEVVRPLSPGDYTEVGGRIAYDFPFFQGRVFLGAGISYYYRWYNEFAPEGAFLGPTDIFGQPLGTPQKRRDSYVEPTAHLIFPNLLAPNVDVRVDYRYERRLTNATTTTQASLGAVADPGVIYDWDVIDAPLNYDNHVAGVHVVGSF